MLVMKMWDTGLEERFLNEIEIPNDLIELKQSVAEKNCKLFLDYLDSKIEKDIINFIWKPTLERTDINKILDYLNNHRFNLGQPKYRNIISQKFKIVNKKLIIFFEYHTKFKEFEFKEEIFIVEERWKVAAYKISKINYERK